MKNTSGERFVALHNELWEKADACFSGKSGDTLRTWRCGQPPAEAPIVEIIVPAATIVGEIYEYHPELVRLHYEVMSHKKAPILLHNALIAAYVAMNVNQLFEVRERQLT